METPESGEIGRENQSLPRTSQVKKAPQISKKDLRSLTSAESG